MRLAIAVACALATVALPGAAQGDEDTSTSTSKSKGKGNGDGVGVRLVELVNRTIAGRLDVGAVSFDLPHTVVIDDVALRDPKGGVVMRIARVRVAVELRALVRREVHVIELVLDAPRFTLAPDGDSLNLLSALKSKTAKETDPNKAAQGRVVIEGVQVKSAGVDYDDGKGTRASLSGVSANATVDVDLASAVVRVQSRGLDVRSGALTLPRDGAEALGLALGPTHIDVLDLVDKDARIEGARALLQGVTITAAGTVNIGDAGTLALAGNFAAPADVKVKGIELPFATPAATSSFAVGGTLKAPTVSADGKLESFAPQGLRIDRTTFAVSATKESIRVQRALAHIGKGSVTASGTLAFESGAVDVKAVGEQLPVARIATAAGVEGAPPGVLGFEATMKGASKGKAPLAVQATLSGDLVRGNVGGDVRIEEELVDLGVDVKLEKLERVLPLGKDDTIGDGAVNGRLSGSFDTPRFAGTAALTRANVKGVPLQGFAAQLDVGKERARVTQLRGTIAGGKLAGDMDAQLVKGGAVRGKVSLTQIDLATLTGPAAGSSGRGDVTLALSGDGALPTVDAVLALKDVSARDETVGDVTVRASANKQRVVVRELTVDGLMARVTSPGVRVELEGTRALEGKLVIEQLVLAQVHALEGRAMVGVVTGDVALAGTVDKPDVTAALDAKGVHASGGALGDGAVRAHFTSERMLEATLALALKEAHIDATLSADLRVESKELIDASLTLTHVEMAPWLALAPETVAPLAGLIDGNVTAKGKLRAPDVIIALRSPNVIARETREALGPLDVQATLKDAVLDARVCAFGVAATEASAKDSTSCAAEDRVRVLARGPLNVESGALALDVDAFVALPNIETLVPALKKSKTAIGTTTHARATISRARSDDALAIHADAELSELRVKREGAPLLQLAEPVKVRYADGVLRVPADEGAPPLVVESSDATGSGGAHGLGRTNQVRFSTRALIAPDNVNIDVDGTVPLVLLKMASNAIANASGSAQVDLAVKGNPHAALVVEGSVVPRAESSITPRATGQRVTFLDGAVRVAPIADGADSAGLARVTLDGLKVELGGGEAIARGTVDVRTALPGASTKDAPVTTRIDDEPARTQAARDGTLDPDTEDETSTPDAGPRGGRVDTGAAIDVAASRSERSKEVSESLVVAWNLTLTGDGLYVRQGDAGAELAFDLALTGAAPDPLLRGTIQVAAGELRKTFALQDFVLSADAPSDPRPLDEQLAPVGLAGLRLDVDITVREFRTRAELPAFSLDAYLRGDLKLSDTIVAPRMAGGFGVETGEIDFPKARFDITDLQIELPTGTPGAPTSPIVLLTAHADVPPGAAGNDTTLPIDLVLDGPIDAMTLDLVATGGGQPYTRADLLSVVLFGKPLDDFGADDGGSRGAMGLVAGQASAAVTRNLAEQIEERFGGQLELNLIADELDADDPRLAAGWRWRVGRRIDLEGTAGLGNAASTSSASTTTAAGTDSARLRLLLFDHLPIGKELAFEGRLARAADPGASTSGDLRLGFRWFEARPSPSWFAFLFDTEPGAASPQSAHAKPRPVHAEPVLVRVEAHVDGGAKNARLRDEGRVRDSVAGLFGRPIGTTKPYVIEAQAEERLQALNAYRTVQCEVVEPASGGTLDCRVTKARVVRQIEFTGLNAGMLQGDLEKRLSIRTGDVIDALARAEDVAVEPNHATAKLARQARALEEYFEREGFHGTHVNVAIKAPATSPSDDDDPSFVGLIATLDGGHFVSVRNVKVDVRGRDHRAGTGSEPVDSEHVASRFRHMCLRADSVVDATFAGGLSCYSRARVRERSEELERELREQGYPEARLRVEPVFVGDSEVDLAVQVRRGPKLTTSIVVDTKGAGSATEVVDLPDVLTDQFLAVRRSLQEPVGRAFGAAWDDDVILEDLEEQLTFESARATDEAEALVSADAIEERLAQRGHPEGDVVTTHAYDEQGDVDVRFVVKPRPPHVVAEVRVEGLHTIDEKDLRDDAALRSKERGVLSSGFVSDAELAADEASLRDALAARGFPEAVVAGRAVRLAPAEDGSERRAIVFDVDEGTRFVVKAVELRGGDAELTGETIAALSSCRDIASASQNVKRLVPADCVGGPLRIDELAADADRIRALYAAKGYPSARVLLEQAFAPDGQVRLRVSVTPAEGEALDKAVLGEVFVQGNTTTSADVLRRELGVTGDDEGAPLDPLSIQKGVSRVRRSGLYSRVNLDYVGLDEPHVPVDVILRVEEKPSLSVDSSIGFSTERLFSLGFETKEKNAFGSMIELGALVDFGLFIGRSSQLQLPARWPRIRGTDLAAALTPFASYRDESSGVKLDPNDPVAGAGETFLGAGPRRRIVATGAAVSLDYAINQIEALAPDKLTVGLAYELRSEWVNLDASPYGAFSAEQFQTVSGLTDALSVAPARIAALTPRVLFSDIDNPFDPLEGLSAEVLFKASSPYWLSEDWFGVLGVRSTGYTTFGERVTLAGRVGMRWGFVADDKPCGDCGWALMQNDLLLLGGERSVRGYGENTIGVRGALFTPRLEDLDAVGPRPGLFGAQASVELRVLAWKNLGIGDLKPAVFVDAGLSTDDVRDSLLLADRLAAHELGMSVGAGLRYVMPVGPALFDCAISPIEQTADGDVVAGCHLALGYTF